MWKGRNARFGGLKRRRTGGAEVLARRDGAIFVSSELSRFSGYLFLEVCFYVGISREANGREKYRTESERTDDRDEMRDVRIVSHI